MRLGPAPRAPGPSSARRSAPYPVPPAPPPLGARLPALCPPGPRSALGPPFCAALPRSPLGAAPRPIDCSPAPRASSRADRRAGGPSSTWIPGALGTSSGQSRRRVPGTVCGGAGPCPCPCCERGRPWGARGCSPCTAAHHPSACTRPARGPRKPQHLWLGLLLAQPPSACPGGRLWPQGPWGPRGRFLSSPGSTRWLLGHCPACPCSVRSLPTSPPISVLYRICPQPSLVGL